MGKDEWNVTSMDSFATRSPDELQVLWSAELPPERYVNPPLWDLLIGFFEDAIVDSCRRPGKLVVTPRELLKQLKKDGKEPPSGHRIIQELFRRGDIVSADALKPPTNNVPSSYSLSSIKASVSSYIWGAPKLTLPSLDDPIVPIPALNAAVERASMLAGPVASADIHTVKTFAASITAGNTRDAEAVISQIVAKGNAAVLFTDPTKDNPIPIMGVKLGKGSAKPADKGVLQTKAALERMEKMAAHLEVAVAAEKTAAVEAASSGNRQDALSKLRKKKLLETKLNGARSAALKLSDVIMAVDEAESNKEAVLALETGMDSLRLATEDGVTADRVDAVAVDFDEAIADQQDVRHALQQLNDDAVGDSAELENELDMMVNESMGIKPAATATETEEEEELLKIMHELGISKEDAALMRDPVEVAMANTAKVNEGEKEDVAESADVDERRTGRITAPDV